MHIWLLLFHENILGIHIQRRTQLEKPCIYVCLSDFDEIFLWDVIFILKSSQMKLHVYKKSRLTFRNLSWNTILKSSQFWSEWRKNIQTLVIKSGSGQFVWLWEMVETNGCCFPVCLGPCHEFFTMVKGLGGRNRAGALEPPEKRKRARVCRFGRETEGGKTFLLMWLSVSPLSYFSCPILASLPLTGFVLSHDLSCR